MGTVLKVKAVRKQRKKLTPWQKIVRSALKSKGLRLTAEEIHQLWMDDAICTRATEDDLGNP